MANYLEQQLGWRSVYAYNQEDFGPESLLGRSSDREIVLARILRAEKRDGEALLLDKLSDVLDDKQKRNKVRNLLYAMSKREKIIESIRQDGKYTWILVEHDSHKSEGV